MGQRSLWGRLALALPMGDKQGWDRHGESPVVDVQRVQRTEVLRMRGHTRVLLAATLTLTWLSAASVDAQQGAVGGEWRHYAGDMWGTKYAPLDQITGENFGDLEVAWRWRTADFLLPFEDEHGISLIASETLFDRLEAAEPGRWNDPFISAATRPDIALQSNFFQAVPLMIDGVLYLSTPFYQAAAIDARTGETRWIYNPRVYEAAPPAPAPWKHRGVAYWENGGEARIFWGTGDGYLTAVDAKTGLLATGFGDNGRVSLGEGLPRARDNPSGLPYPSRSAPLIVGDTIIIGAPSTISDFVVTKESTPGFVRAYDARTGRHKWDFHNVPQSADEFGADTWQNESWRYSGHTNTWGNITADPELGYVYLPTSAPTSDFYGGERVGDNLFADSLVCVDVETGERVWHFQMVHHGLWNYDTPAGPNLLDITVDGRRVKAAAQVTKQGFVYTFDRVTGEPVWPIDERPVPTDTDLEGEVPSPTQPFPTKPAPLEYQGTSIDDLVDFTPEVRQMAAEAVEGFRLGPLYTPHSLRGTIHRPGGLGAASWGGAAVDPETGILYVPSNNLHSVVRFREPEPDEGSNLRYLVSRGAEPFLEGGNPRRQPPMPPGLPLWKPPYSRMTAIDMNTGEHLWMTPTGNGDPIRNHPLLRHLDLPPLGGEVDNFGPLLTKTLLIYALASGGTDDSPQLVAYDKLSGEVLAAVDLPGSAIGTPRTYTLDIPTARFATRDVGGAAGTPITYMLDGRQYIALTVGGETPALIALRLP